MQASEWKVASGTDATTVSYEPASAPDEAGVFVCAHGAGGNMSDKGMLSTANALRASGIGVVRFNFIYKEKNSARPDPMPKLMATFAAVVARVRDELGPQRLVIGGRSMGGRAASMLAADGFDAHGLLLLAYPLHPAGQPEKLRDAHLPSITMPVIGFSGTRDTLCRRDLMDHALTTVKTKWDMRWIDGADHSFHVLKSSGRTDADVIREIADESRKWIDALPSTPAGARS
jgi:predicted alpha/beta-hydrolase family hydrolase